MGQGGIQACSQWISEQQLLCEWSDFVCSAFTLGCLLPALLQLLQKVKMCLWAATPPDACSSRSSRATSYRIDVTVTNHEVALLAHGS